MLLEAVQIANSLLDKLWANKLSASMPQVAIRSKDRVTEELLPVVVEKLALAIVVELPGQDGFDVLNIGGDDDALAGWPGLEGEAAFTIASEESLPAFHIGVLHAVVDGASDHVNSWAQELVRALCSMLRTKRNGLRTEWSVCGGIESMSSQRLNAPLLRNPLRDDPENIRGKETDEDGLRARMLIDMLEDTHDGGCFFPRPSKGTQYAIVKVTGCYVRLKMLKNVGIYFICRLQYGEARQRSTSSAADLRVESAIYTAWVRQNSSPSRPPSPPRCRSCFGRSKPLHRSELTIPDPCCGHRPRICE